MNQICIYIKNSKYYFNNDLKKEYLEFLDFNSLHNKTISYTITILKNKINLLNIASTYNKNDIEHNFINIKNNSKLISFNNNDYTMLTCYLNDFLNFIETNLDFYNVSIYDKIYIENSNDYDISNQLFNMHF